MKSLNQHTGYLEIDHRDSPGLSPADAAQVPGTLVVPGGERLERDIKQCSHCQRTVVLNPGRVRTRAVCVKCHHYICDGCDETYRKTGACVPFLQILDRAEDIAQKFVGQPDHPEAAIDPVALGSETAPRITVPDTPSAVVLADA